MGCSGFASISSPQCQTKKDAYPLLHMQETMESMVGAGHFSCMDLKSGFWQVKMAEESQQYTAFTVGSCRVMKTKGIVFRCMWVYSKEDTMAHTCRLVVTS